MAAVEILESCMVTPGEATPKHRLWLSVIDLIQKSTHTPLVFLYRLSPGTAAACFSPEILKAALAKALVPFYPIAGRLASDASGRPEIDCTGDGVLFVTARADATLDDEELANPAPSDELRRRLVPAAEDTGALAMFQVTFFRCGGVCLGTAIHHTACDGRAFGYLLKTWAAIARGDDGEAATLLPQPSLDRTPLRGRSPPAVRFPHGEYPRRGSVPSETTTPFGTAVFPVSKTQVAALKRAAGEKVSTFSATVAHVWRCSCTAKGLAGTANTQIHSGACVRSRVRPPLPPGYLGNAVARIRTPAALKVSDVVAGPLGAAAGVVAAAVDRMSDGYVRSLVDHMELAMGGDGAPGGLQQGPWAVPDTDLFVVSWIGLPMNDLHFGGGRPAFIGRAVFKLSNLLYLVPCPDGGGGLNVIVSMEPRALSRFRGLFYDGLEHYSSLMVSQKHAAQDAHGVKHAKL